MKKAHWVDERRSVLRQKNPLVVWQGLQDGSHDFPGFLLDPSRCSSHGLSFYAIKKCVFPSKSWTTISGRMSTMAGNANKSLFPPQRATFKTLRPSLMVHWMRFVCEKIPQNPFSAVQGQIFGHWQKLSRCRRQANTIPHFQHSHPISTGLTPITTLS